MCATAAPSVTADWGTTTAPDVIRGKYFLRFAVKTSVLLDDARHGIMSGAHIPKWLGLTACRGAVEYNYNKLNLDIQ